MDLETTKPENDIKDLKRGMEYQQELNYRLIHSYTDRLTHTHAHKTYLL